MLRTCGAPLPWLLVACSLACLTSGAFADELDVRLRLAWGSGDSAKHRWIGRITCDDAKMSDLQPLGIEADAPAAIQLIGNE